MDNFRPLSTFRNIDSTHRINGRCIASQSCMTSARGCLSEAAVGEDLAASLGMHDTIKNATILAVDGEGNVVKEMDGIVMELSAG